MNTDSLVVAMIQQPCAAEPRVNLAATLAAIEQAAAQGAHLIVLQELHNHRYFCQREDSANFALAEPLPGPSSEQLAAAARRWHVVIVASLFERRAPGLHHNTAVVFDSDGHLAGRYRKMHVPDDPGYHEKFYFTPGDLGFTPIDTSLGRLGVLVCWDQWFPEAARAMVLMGAEMLLYPSAIGSEPQDPDYDSRDHWRRVMQGHAAANMVPVVAANRVGTERGESCTLTFYGSSFVTDGRGAILTQAGREEEAVITARFDLDALARERAGWGLFRDRRPDLYLTLLSLDGRGQSI